MGYKEKIRQRKTLRELRKAKAELSMLLSYLGECEDALKDYSAEWNSDIKFVLESLSSEKNNVQDTEYPSSSLTDKSAPYKTAETPHDHSEESEIKSSAPKWVKKAFRKIALKTHPDKVRDHKDAKELEALYAQANAAISDENYDVLLEICNLLSIENNLDPKVELEYNTKRKDGVKEDLKKITESIPWIWCEAYEDTALRKKILFSVLPHYGIDTRSEDIISGVLEKLLER